MKHKHYDCIVAWAEGKTIECRYWHRDRFDDPWEIVKTPQWNEPNFEFRIKKEPVIEVKYYIRDSCGDYLVLLADYKGIWHLKITYQDGVAIKAEVAE